MSQLILVLMTTLSVFTVFFAVLCWYVYRDRDAGYFRFGAQMLARARARDLARDIASVFDAGRSPEFGDAVEYVRAQAVGLARDFDLACDLGYEPAHDLLAILEDLLGQAEVDAIALARVRTTACLLAQLLTGESVVALPTWQTIRGASRVSRRLVDRTIKMLPAAHRSRYSEEFRSELAELVETSSRWRQLIYAVRLLSRSIRLRLELRDAAPEQAQ